LAFYCAGTLTFDLSPCSLKRERGSGGVPPKEKNKTGKPKNFRKFAFKTIMMQLLQHKYLKLAVGLVLLGLSIWQFTKGHIGNGIFLLLLFLLVMFLYVRNEYLLAAFFKLRKEDMEGAERILMKIRNPEQALIKPQQAYYNMLLGMIYSRKNISKAEKFLRKALKLGLVLKQDQAMAKLSLAGIMMAKRNKREATRLLNEAKKLDKKGLMKDQIRMMKQQLKRI